MYVAVGHSAGLRFTMDDRLYDEIGRGLYWFFFSLLAGSIIISILLGLAYCCCLQKKIVGPISKLAKQI